jgi:hypothetical protein
MERPPQQQPPKAGQAVAQAQQELEVLLCRVKAIMAVTLAHLPQMAAAAAVVLVLLEEPPHRMLGATVAMV